MKRLRGLGDIEQFDPLLVFLGAERRGDQRLRFAAGEQRRAVRARQDVRLRSMIWRTSIERAAIRTAARPSASRRGRSAPSSASKSWPPSDCLLFGTARNSFFLSSSMR